jgi:glucose uptake protein GlcU
MLEVVGIILSFSVTQTKDDDDDAMTRVSGDGQLDALVVVGTIVSSTMFDLNSSFGCAKTNSLSSKSSSMLIIMGPLFLFAEDENNDESTIVGIGLLSSIVGLFCFLKVRKWKHNQNL